MVLAKLPEKQLEGLLANVKVATPRDRGGGVCRPRRRRRSLVDEARADGISRSIALRRPRIQRVEGEVALNNSDPANAQSDQWTTATANQPFSVGDRIYTRDSRARVWHLPDAISPGSIQTRRSTCLRSATTARS